MIRALFLIMLLSAQAGARQTARPVEVRATAGWFGFIDEDWDDHAGAGASIRRYFTPRLSVGPEILYLRGPRDDREILLVPHLAFDLRSRGRATPYFLIGAGLSHHRDRFGSTTFTNNEWTMDGGFGVKVFLKDRVFVSPEVRLGFEPLVRFTGSVGFVF